MVSGHLQIKKGYYYVVLSYYDNRNKRHVKYVSTGLPEKGNKRKAEAVLARVRSEFERRRWESLLPTCLLRSIFWNGWTSSRCV